MTRSDYYYTINKIDKDEKNQELTEEIKAIYAEHKKRYGFVVSLWNLLAAVSVQIIKKFSA